MKLVIQIILKHFARAILKKYQPLVIGITGSVGKTSTKEAVFTVLGQNKRVRQNIKNYNNEIGLPLTIIGSESPGRSIYGWILLTLRTLSLLLRTNKNYPEILVLEMGVDRIGDMDYLNSIVSCQIGVVTLIGPVHLEYFGTIEKIQKEKGKLIEQLPKDGFAILNYDNEKTRQIKNISKAKVLTYGFDEKADVRAQEMIFSFDQQGKLRGTSFKITYRGSSVPVSLPNVLGTSAVYAALAGAAVGITQSMNLVEISQALRDFKSPRGRMNLIAGIKNTLIVDDTYNASPQSAIAALGVLKEIPIVNSAKRIAVLGDMLELGSYSEEGHQEVGKYLAKFKINKLITVGECSRDIDRGAKDAGMSEDDIFHFADSESAGRFLQEIINKGDLILIKGSQGMRMEKIVKEIMAEPLRAIELLVRQEKEWLKR
jgi:UDP-N-acetylmuramoyl-tripeptide--D-alanyl-D-alanine ligase